jgi:hypothetical protein
MKKKVSNLKGTSIRFESEYKADLEKEAEIHNISTSEYIRSLIDQGRTYHTESIQLSEEIARLNTNFNKCQGDNLILKEINRKLGSALDEINQTKSTETPDNPDPTDYTKKFFRPTIEQGGYLILTGIIFVLLILGIANIAKESQHS